MEVDKFSPLLPCHFPTENLSEQANACPGDAMCCNSLFSGADFRGGGGGNGTKASSAFESSC